MRSAIGEMELDEILHGRARLNALIKGSLQEAALPWGLEIRRYEITEITPDHQIRIAMDKQAAAERARREHVLRADESEGNLIRITNEAEAAKARILLEAQGQAEAIRLTARAQADALAAIAAELNKTGGQEAARLALARDYVTMYGEMGKESNTIMFNDRPADINALLSQAVVSMQAAGAATAPKLTKLEAVSTIDASITKDDHETTDKKDGYA
jgi:regulator of protease activity HflC (stomatin/prohibitin superfamily)